MATEDHPLKTKIKLMLDQNQRKAEKLDAEYGVGLDAVSAFHYRIATLIQHVNPEVDKTLPLPIMLEYLITELVGSIEDVDDEGYPARLAFEAKWQEVIAEALENAHAEANKAKREAASKLIIPNGMGPERKLHRP